jgi:hypothetical protein
MRSYPPAYRTLRIIAQDPSVRNDAGAPVSSEVRIPAEDLLEGPRGFRAHVIDYDASRGVMYKPYGRLRAQDVDPFADGPDIESPQFHSQNVYAIVMRTLCRFEKALGRRVSWSFRGHQLKVAPHAFAEANAFYSSRDESLLFGYFTGADRMPVYTCLSHDIVAHETTHAVLDGLRDRYIYPSGPDQAAFHEGFSDIVALLSVFSLRDLVAYAVHKAQQMVQQAQGEPQPEGAMIDISALTANALREGVLLGLGEQFGTELGGRFGALRRSVSLEPSPDYLTMAEYDEAHRRGEILVASVFFAMLEAYIGRLDTLGKTENGLLPERRVAEEGAEIADRLLTMVIRALDYSPPTDLRFADYLSAILTADYEAQPDDSRYELRRHLREAFASFGIEPTSDFGGDGLWEPPLEDLQANERGELVYSCARHEALQRDREEVFRFLWENRRLLKLCDEAFTRVESVRPCMRVNEDGFTVRETIADYVQILRVEARELSRYHIYPPRLLPNSTVVTLYGGGALVFDDFGRLKYHIGNSVLSTRKQSERLEYLFMKGRLDKAERPRAVAAIPERRFATMHLSGMGAEMPSASKGDAWPDNL